LCFRPGRDGFPGPWGEQGLTRSVTVFSGSRPEKRPLLFRERSHERFEKANTIGLPRQWGYREKSRYTLMSVLRPGDGSPTHGLRTGIRGSDAKPCATQMVRSFAGMGRPDSRGTTSVGSPLQSMARIWVMLRRPVIARASSKALARRVRSAPFPR